MGKNTDLMIVDPLLFDDHRENENQRLIENAPPTASLWSTIYNLVNTTVGVGVLALPYALKRAGLALGLILIVSLGSLAGFSHMLLTWSSEVSAQRSYREIAMAALGFRMGLILDVLIVGQTVGGGLTAFPIIIGSTVTDLAKDWISEDSLLTDRAVVIFGIMWLVVYPLCLFPKLHFLQYTSAFAIICAVSIPVVLTFTYLEGTDEQSELDIVYFNWDWELFLAIPLITASYSAHFNSVRLYRELKDHTPQLMKKVVSTSIFFILAIYCTSGIMGYMSFLGDTESDVLENLDSEKEYVALTKLSIVLLLIFSYPVVQFACRSSLSNIIFAVYENTLPRRAFLSAIIVGITSTLAYFVPDIAVVFSFSASTAAVAVIWLIPALVYHQFHPEPRYAKIRFLAKIQFALGVIFGALGLYVAFTNVL